MFHTLVFEVSLSFTEWMEKKKQYSTPPSPIIMQEKSDPKLIQT